MSYWADLLGAQVRQVRGRYRTRVLEAGAGPALLLLHGTGGHLENYARNIPRLARQFRVIAIDLLWHGLSQADGYDPEIIPLLVDQVADVLDVLDIEQAAVEGQSLGGWVAMQAALQHPQRVRQLVLVTTQGYVPDEGAIPGYAEPDWAANIPDSVEALRNPTYDNVYKRMARILANPAGQLTEEAVRVRQALYSRPELATVAQAFVTGYLGGEAIRKHVVTDAMAARISCPALVYWGAANRTPPALGQRLSRQVADGRFHCARDAGHWAQFESAEEHDEVVAGFLASTAPARKR